MSEKKLRAAVVGCGNISRSHFSAITACGCAELVAVCDTQRERADAAAEKFGVRAYYDMAALLGDRIADVIHICTPHYLHATMAIAALETGHHVFCEKPMAIRYDDALQIKAAAENSGKYFGVCFQNRYNDASRLIKSALESGRLGAVRGSRSVVAWDRNADYYLADAWRGKIDTEGGGVMINQAIHTLDLTAWLVGSPVTAVQASISTKRLADFIEVEDTADLLMQYENGARGVFYATLCAAENAPVEITINCEKGKIILSEQLIIRETGCADEVYDIRCGTGAKAYWGNGHTYIIRDFYDCILTGGKFPVDADEAIKSVRMTDMLYAAAGRREPRKY
ncbi:MAG: Gfo/Idh/MocA family oxidoreductase [Clostridia bacterium]|nr:Gfo/Idh/MocA family oxidoreductase [Clostridia bacterium]